MHTKSSSSNSTIEEFTNLTEIRTIYENFKFSTFSETN